MPLFSHDSGFYRFIGTNKPSALSSQIQISFRSDGEESVKICKMSDSKNCKKCLIPKTFTRVCLFRGQGCGVPLVLSWGDSLVLFKGREGVLSPRVSLSCPAVPPGPVLLIRPKQDQGVPTSRTGQGMPPPPLPPGQATPRAVRLLQSRRRTFLYMYTYSKYDTRYKKHFSYLFHVIKLT